MPARRVRIAFGGILVALVTGVGFVSVPGPSPARVVYSAFLMRPNVALGQVPEQVKPEFLGAVAAVPSPKPTPAPAAPIQRPAQQCPPVVLNSLTAYAVAFRQVLVTWSVTGGCPPFHGEIGASYFAAGVPHSWPHPLAAPWGAYRDSVRPPPGPPCRVSITYTLTFGGSPSNLMATARDVYIC